jgi:hypothetical protein
VVPVVPGETPVVLVTPLGPPLSSSLLQAALASARTATITKSIFRKGSLRYADRA